MERLTYAVVGSTGSRYTVIFEGDGPSLQAFCSCPAFKRGGQFCKHAAALLVGDVTALQPGSSKIEDLRPRTEGSSLYSLAVTHRPAPPRVQQSDFKTLDEAIDVFVALGKAADLQVTVDREVGSNVALALEYQARGKRGTYLKTPIASLHFEAMIEDMIVSPHHEDGYVSVSRPRLKPWLLRLEKQSYQYIHLGGALTRLQGWLADRRQSYEPAK